MSVPGPAPGDRDRLVGPGLRADVRPLVVEDITLRFGGIRALDGVGFTVTPGTVHALIGPNGAGKSSCFNVISGLYRPTSGRVLLGDTVLTDLAPHRLAGLGVGRSFQNVVLSPTATVLDNVLLGRHGLLRRAGLRGRRRHCERVAEICAFLGVEEWLHAPVSGLPYGVAKRVDIARALAVEPTVLLLDEPAAGLTSSETAEMAAMIGDLRDTLGISVLLVEHDMSLVMGIADRVTVLDFGRLIADDVPAVVQADPEVIRAYLGSGDEDGGTATDAAGSQSGTLADVTGSPSATAGSPPGAATDAPRSPVDTAPAGPFPAAWSIRRVLS